jgi:hypothetical protein
VASGLGAAGGDLDGSEVEGREGVDVHVDVDR